MTVPAKTVDTTSAPITEPSDDSTADATTTSNVVSNDVATQSYIEKLRGESAGRRVDNKKLSTENAELKLQLNTLNEQGLAEKEKYKELAETVGAERDALKIEHTAMSDSFKDMSEYFQTKADILAKQLDDEQIIELIKDKPAHVQVAILEQRITKVKPPAGAGAPASSNMDDMLEKMKDPAFAKELHAKDPKLFAELVTKQLKGK